MTDANVKQATTGGSWTAGKTEPCAHCGTPIPIWKNAFFCTVECKVWNPTTEYLHRFKGKPACSEKCAMAWLNQQRELG